MSDNEQSILEKGQRAFLKKQEEDKDKQAVVNDRVFEKMLKLANERFGEEFSWTQSKAGKYYIIVNIETGITLGSLLTDFSSLVYVKKCKDCGEYVGSVDVYLHSIPSVKDGTIKFYHNCRTDPCSPDQALTSKLEDFVIAIIEDHQH
jgi:hypothetical protein